MEPMGSSASILPLCVSSQSVQTGIVNSKLLTEAHSHSQYELDAQRWLEDAQLSLSPTDYPRQSSITKVFLL